MHDTAHFVLVLLLMVIVPPLLALLLLLLLPLLLPVALLRWDWVELMVAKLTASVVDAAEQLPCTAPFA